MKNKKLITWAVIIFVAYFLINRPNDAANVVRGAMGTLEKAGDSMVAFFSSVFVS